MDIGLNIFPKDGVCIVTGSSGCGKTFRMMKLFDQLPEPAIFVNPMNKTFSKGPYCSTQDEVIASLNEYGKAVFNCDDEREISSLLDYCRGVYSKPQPYPLRIFIDETDLFAKLYTHGSSVERLFSKDRNRGLLAVGLVQSNTGQVSAIVKRNPKVFIFFRLHPGEYQDVKRLFHIPRNPDEYCYYRYMGGKIWYGDKNGNEIYIGDFSNEIEKDKVTGK